MTISVQGTITFVFYLSLLTRGIICLQCRGEYTCISIDACEGAKEVLHMCDRSKLHVCCPNGHQRLTYVASHLTAKPKIAVTPPPVEKHKNLKFLQRECGVSFPANRISSGTIASPEEFPWMALLVFEDKRGNVYFKCGGTLINNRYILTAAHCLTEDASTLRYVRLAEYQLSEDSNSTASLLNIPILKKIPHTGWNIEHHRNDIALLRLNETSVKLLKDRPDIQPICLPLNENEVSININTTFEAAGWGTTNDEQENSDILLKVQFTNNNEDDCMRKCTSGKHCPLTKNQICIQGNRLKNVCKGDSGGPLMVAKQSKMYQVGITSFSLGGNCGKEGIPSIFTRVSEYIPWILDNMEP